MIKTFDKQSIAEVHSRLTSVIKEFCKAEGLEYVGSNLKYTPESFDAKVSVKVPGGLSIKEKRDTLGSDLDRNGAPIKAGDAVTDLEGQRFTIFGFKRVKTIVLDANGKKWLVPTSLLTKSA